MSMARKTKFKLRTRKHRKTHDRPYQCNHSSCRSSFASATDLERHESTHDAIRAIHHCPWRKQCCFSGAKASRSLRLHIKNKHSDKLELTKDPKRELKRICQKERDAAEALVEVHRVNAEAFKTAERCDCVAIEAAIVSGLDPNMRDHKDNTLLMTVVKSRSNESKKVEAIDILLKHGADINQISCDHFGRYEYTVVDFACIYNPSIHVMRKLVENGGKIRGQEATTAFKYFCKSGYHPQTYVLLTIDPRRRVYTDKGRTVLTPEEVQWTSLLLSAGIQRCSDLVYLLGRVIDERQPKLALGLLNYDLHVDAIKGGAIPLRKAIWRYSEDSTAWHKVIVALLKAGADPSFYDYGLPSELSAISIARRKGLTEVIPLLEAHMAEKTLETQLDAGTDLFKSGGEIDTVEMLT